MLRSLTDYIKMLPFRILTCAVQTRLNRCPKSKRRANVIASIKIVCTSRINDWFIKKSRAFNENEPRCFSLGW